MARKTKLFFCILALCIFALCTAYAEETTCTEHNYDYSTMQSDESYHWYACVNCGAPENQWPHEVSCSSAVQDTCAICAKTGVSCMQTHNYDLDNYQYDDTHHWAACTNCQAQVNNGEHALNCTTGVCDGCGQSGVSGYTSHSVTGEYEYDNDNHWQICSRCNEAVYTSHHGVHCDAVSDACVECGQTGVDIHVWHSYDWNDVVYDETEHWRICEGCGVKTGDSLHYVRCDQADKTVCYECGAATSGSNVSHTVDWDAPQHDDTYHWYICTSCGAEVNKGTHWLSCWTGECGGCGQTGVNGDISHEVDWENYERDATHHWYSCVHCGERLNYAEHGAYCDTADTACAECGQTGVELNTWHEYDFDTKLSDSEYHWIVCVNCGDETNRGTHYYTCAGEGSPSECAECGATGVSCSMIHQVDGSQPFEYDATHHWHTCESCGAQCHYYEHVLDCQTGICRTCDNGGVEGNVGHDVDWETYGYDADYHWNLCKNCGEMINHFEHGLSCVDGACRECGQTGVNGYTGHSYNWEDAQYTATEHWHICQDCGEEVDRGEHWLSCVTGVCHGCGKSGVEGNIGHSYNWEDAQDTTTEHWYICQECGEEVERDGHWLDCATGTCHGCGQTGVEGNVTHEYDWESYQHDADYHWRQCVNCSAEIEKWEHTLSCTTGACLECGQSGVNGDTGHACDWADAQYTATEHWTICQECGEEVYRGEHWLDCVTGVCYGCGQSGVEGGVGHSYNWEDAQYTTTEHWYPCLNCGEEVDRGEHRLDCQTGMCRGCGQSGVEGNVGHEYDWENPKYDEDYHWYLCVNCGLEMDKWEHSVACDTGACRECGQTGVIGYVSHQYGQEDAHYDETYHWFTCQACGEEVDKGEHWMFCTSDVCYGCGQSGVEGYINHECDWDTPLYNETHHWYICLSCGEEADKSNHWPSCTTGICNGCGLADAAGEPDHRVNWNKAQYDADSHWYICQNCGEEVYKDTHWLHCQTGVCVTCGQTDVNGEVQHEMDWKRPEYDATNHWYVCTLCGESSELSKHGYVCTESSDVCGVCGQAAAEYEVWHSFYSTQAYAYDETHHWKVCIDCGGKAIYNEHMVEEDGTCYCGATGLALPCEHEFELVAVVEATCVEAGIGEVTCIHCGEVDGEEAIPALGHDAVETVTEATCTKAGVKESICEVCGEVVSSEEIPALGHDAVETVTEATCTEAGVKESICEVCGEVVSSEAIPALGHDAVETVTEATCTKAGVKESICEVCGEVVSSEAIPALGHDAVETVTEATCTEAGVKESICEVCGEVVSSEEIPALGHDAVETVTEATCTEAGVKESICEVCGEVVSSEAIPALGHDAVETITEATCTEAGVKESICEVCDEVVSSEAIPALGHDAVETITEATCTKAGVKESICEVCGEVVSSEEIPALGHNYEDVVTTEATCTAAGLLESICSSCGEVESSQSISALGHDRWFTVTSAATCTQSGVHTYYCHRCNVTLESKTVAAKGHNLTTTDTGDALVESCSRCDYEVVTAKATAAPSVAPTAEPTVAPTVEPTAEPTPEATEEPVVLAPVVLPEDTVIVPVEEAVIEGATEEIQIVVHEVELKEEEPILPLPVEIEPVKVLTVSVVVPESLAEEEEIAVPEQVTAVITLQEEEVAALEGMKLVLVLSDGTMIEVPYEVVDGKLVFTTSQMGVFAFIPADQVV